MLRETLPDDLPVVFISSVANMGLTELKDILWQELNSESNKLQSITQEDVIVHRDKEPQPPLAPRGGYSCDSDMFEELDIEYIDEEEIEEIEEIEDEEE